MIKAVSFDVGHTLIKYNNPLNWKALYRPALKQVSGICNLFLSDEQLKAAVSILTKYNTRENPRMVEVISQVIFREIFDAWNLSHDELDSVRAAFYGFFQNDAVCYDDVAETLEHLRALHIQMGVLTDVAYGMDNAFSLRDIATIRHYFDLVLTSVDVGYRKPHPNGFLALLQEFNLSPSEMMYIGDEQKDIAGANALGIVSVLINRSESKPEWGQVHTIQTLSDLLPLL